MTNTNDQRILELKAQIELKKEKLGKILKFTPVTNCSIELDGTRHNIQVLNKEQLISLMVKLNAYYKSAKELGVANDYIISGYIAEDWIGDIQIRLAILKQREEQQALKAMEDKLLKLLSDRKKVELEIDEIESLLKD